MRVSSKSAASPSIEEATCSMMSLLIALSVCLAVSCHVFKESASAGAALAYSLSVVKVAAKSDWNLLTASVKDDSCCDSHSRQLA